MSIEASRVSRVVIAGEWYTVEVGSFEVVELAFVDDTDEPTHPPTDALAYHFFTPNHDEYWGPLAAVQLVKLVEQ